MPAAKSQWRIQGRKRGVSRASRRPCMGGGVRRDLATGFASIDSRLRRRAIAVPGRRAGERGESVA